MTDGLKAYRCVATDKAWQNKNLTHHWVSHGKYQFTKLVDVKNEVLQAGIQMLDGMWDNLKNDLRSKRGVAHEHLGKEVRVFQCFFVRGEGVDPVGAFADVVKQAASLKLLSI